MLSRETRVDINFLQRQGLSYREIARKTGRDRRTVKRYAENPDLIGQGRAKVNHQSILDPFRPVIEAWLEDDQEYRATWIFDQLRKLGYTGGYSVVRDAVRELKQENSRLAYLRFETEPGRQAQVDFGDYKIAQPDESDKTLYLFSMILGFSRKPYCEFLDRCDMTSFLDAHQRAFAYFGGVPATILYDRMRNVFIRKVAGKAEFTQGLMSLANHYGFNPEVAPAYSPWVKGKVERPMDFIREGFWRGYLFNGVQTANRDLLIFLEEKAQRVHGTTGEKVADRFEQEKSFLLDLPPTQCDVSERLFRVVHKDCTISVEGCRYEVPHTLVGKKVVVRLKDRTLRVFDGDRLVATHAQPTTKGKLVQLPGLREAILADRQMNARKYDQRRRGKAKATISPMADKYAIDVQTRPLDIYRQIGGGEVTYA